MTARRIRAVPILHPSYILRGKWGLEPAQVLYLRRVRRLLDGEEPPDPSPTSADMLICPTLHELDVWYATGDLSAGVACDIEAAGDVLVAIGFCRLSDLKAVCVPFRRKGGDPWWPDPCDAVRAARWCARILEDPTIPLVFHHGAYDVPKLRKLGFHVAGWEHDTMVMIHTAYPEFPKRLSFLGSLVGLPEWKQLVGDKGADDTDPTAEVKE